MLSDKLKELNEAKARLAALEQAVASEMSSELARLPARYGFESADAFIAAVQSAGGTKRRGRPAQPVQGNAKPAVGKRRKRAKITDTIRAEVKKLSNEGKTGPEIAKAVGISEQSVFNVRKALGLTRKGK